METRGTKRQTGAGSAGETSVAERAGVEVQVPADCSGYWILTGSQEFIRRTFAFLPARTLAVCSRVCKAWQTVAKRVLQQREDIGWATYGRLQAESETADNCLDPLGPFGVHLDQCLQSIGSLPYLAIVFLGNWPLSGESHSKARRNALLLRDLQTRLPAQTTVACVVACGTIGYKPDLSPAGDNEDGEGVSCVLLPRMDGVGVHCQWLSLNLLSADTTGEYMKAHRPPANTRCVLVFQDCQFRRHNFSYANVLQEDLYDAYGTRPTICGGYGRQVMLHSESGDQYWLPVRRGHALTIAFSGPRVRAASVVVEADICRRAEVRERLGQLKAAVLAAGWGLGRTLAFMFTCAGRGSYVYQQPDVESATFHELFPSTPLVGFFGVGEWGRNNFPGDPPEPQGSLDLTFSCVFCLISFG